MSFGDTITRDIDWVHQQLLIRERNLEVRTWMIKIIRSCPDKVDIRHDLVLEKLPTRQVVLFYDLPQT